MPVSETSNTTTLAAWLSTGWPGSSLPSTALTDRLTCALGGELEGVGQQVLQHLLQPLGVGQHGAAQLRIELHLEAELAGFRLVAERPRHRFDDIGEADFLGLHRDGAGFDLGEVENVADQVEQIGAGAMDGAGEIHLLERQVAGRDCPPAAGPGSGC